MKQIIKKIVSCIFIVTLVLTVPTLALAYNWSVQVSGDCQKLHLVIQVKEGDSKEPSHYELYWSKDGNPVARKEVGVGSIPILQKGEVYHLTYDVTKNPHGPKGHYVFHLMNRSQEVVVTDCKPTKTPLSTKLPKGGDIPGGHISFINFMILGAVLIVGGILTLRYHK